jgi:exodeoxyribonuclease V gamma subunit
MKTMQGVPFKVICLVGMNEGDFPRIGAHNPFDLMEKKGQSRVGDRSKSQDDRSLMLQGLLCAREKLYISWSAFNDRDNSVKSPSVLVTQLRQYVQDKWSERFLASLTSCHPMQPFSLEYFKKDSRLQTYSNEWYAIHKKGLLSGGLPGVKSNFKSDPFKSVQSIHPKEGSISKDVLNKEDSCTFNAIVRCLKNPVKDYFRQILSIDFPQLEVEKRRLVKHPQEGKGGEQDVIQQPSNREQQRHRAAHKGAFPWHKDMTPVLTHVKALHFSRSLGRG